MAMMEERVSSEFKIIRFILCLTFVCPGAADANGYGNMYYQKPIQQL